MRALRTKSIAEIAERESLSALKSTAKNALIIDQLYMNAVQYDDGSRWLADERVL